MALEGESEEEADASKHIRKADKKKKKKEDEKKKRTKEKHGVVDSPTLAPTPPPQQHSVSMEPKVEYAEDVEDVAAVEQEEEKKKKSSKNSKSAKPAVAADSNSDGSDADQDDATTSAAANVDEDGDELTLDLSVKKKKLSNKERKKLKEEAQKILEVTPVGEGSTKPPDNKVFAVSATSVDKESDAWKTSRDVVIESFSISTVGKTLFHNASLKLANGRRYGLVGPNGLGKSVLLRAIANKELPVPDGIDTFYVEQEVHADDTPAVDVVLSADARRTYLITREQELMKMVDDPKLTHADEIYDELIKVSEELRLSQADAAEAKALRLLRGLGFSDDMCRMPTKQLSGGWRMRVSIAKGLFMEPTLLLLDEPTNHLHLEAVIFLETVLSKWEKTLVIVSHDRDFLDEVVQECIHVNDQKLDYYKGNYSAFEKLFDVKNEQRKKDYDLSQKRLKEEKQSKNKLTARERDNQLKKKQREGGASKRKGGAAEDEEAIAIAATGKNRGEKDLDAAAASKRPKDYVVKFSFPSPSELAPPIIQVRDVGFRYNENAPWLFKDLNFGIDMDSRITIAGENGVGKSTLINLITQDLSATQGEIIINRHLRCAVYKQHFIEALPLNLTPIEYLHRKHNIPEQDVRQRLGRYGLSGVSHTVHMNALSGGQKARVVFTDMSYQNPHIIIMDEPTNNLDRTSILALIDAINEFEGGVIVVTHDMQLIEDTNMILWVLEDQKVWEQEGGIDEYKQEILDKLERRELKVAEVLREKQAKRVSEREAKIKEFEERKAKAKAEAAAATKQ